MFNISSTTVCIKYIYLGTTTSFGWFELYIPKYALATDPGFAQWPQPTRLETKQCQTVNKMV